MHAPMHTEPKLPNHTEPLEKQLGGKDPFIAKHKWQCWVVCTGIASAQIKIEETLRNLQMTASNQFEKGKRRKSNHKHSNCWKLK